MDINQRLFKRAMQEPKVAFVPSAPAGGDPAAAGGAPPPPPGGDPMAGGMMPPPPGGDPMAGGMPPPPGGDPMAGGGDPMAGGMPPGDLLDAIGGGMPGEEGGGGVEPGAEPGGNNVAGSPDDNVTRGQADVVMDIVERTLASTGKGKTKTQQEAEFDMEQQKSQQEMDQEAAMGPEGAMPGGGGPMGDMGGAMDPSMFAGPLSGSGADKNADRAMQAGTGMVADAMSGLQG